MKDLPSPINETDLSIEAGGLLVLAVSSKRPAQTRPAQRVQFEVKDA
jgi:hypothetical protein